MQAQIAEILQIEGIAVARSISDEDFGAWLLRCNPKDVWDLPAFIADGGEWIYDWSVVNNYRSRMMTSGDRVVFWVSGDSSKMARGIWGAGYIVGSVHDEIPQDLEPNEIDYWLSEEARLAVTNSIDVDIPLFVSALSDQALRSAGINDLEVQRMPQGSNPSWVTKDQLAHLEPLLPPWPEPMESIEELLVSGGKVGLGDPQQNFIIETAAMTAVKVCYSDKGWAVDDVSADKVGWDLTCTSEAGQVAKVEVKGLSGERPIVVLTANEILAAQTEGGWLLAVVTRAISNPTIAEFTADRVVGAATPYVFKADLTGIA